MEIAPLNRLEISGPELVESNPEVDALFEKIGWGLFFKGFSGHHVEITRRFTMSLKDDVAQVGDFQLILNEDLIAKASKLPQIGERWFKGQRVNKKKCEMFLLPLPEGLDLGRGVSIKFLKPQCRVCFEISIRYVTCDDCYPHIHYYHLRLLMTLKGCIIHLPFFLLQNIRKIAHTV